MAGSPIKRARKEIAEQALLRAAHERLSMSAKDLDRAILQAYNEKSDPVLLMMPTARALLAAADGGDVPAIKEVFERVSGKVVQEVDLGEGDVRPGITITILQAGQQALALTDLRTHDALEALQSPPLEGEVSDAEPVPR